MKFNFKNKREHLKRFVIVLTCLADVSYLNGPSRSKHKTSKYLEWEKKKYQVRCVFINKINLSSIRNEMDRFRALKSS